MMSSKSTLINEDQTITQNTDSVHKPARKIRPYSAAVNQTDQDIGLSR